MSRARLIAVVALIAASVTVSASAAPVRGEQHVLILLSTTGAQPYSVADVQQVADAAAAFYRSSSSGRLQLHIDVTPWLDVFQADPGCRFASVSTVDQTMQPAQRAAEAAGYRPSDYDELVYDVADSPCGFFGITRGREVVLTKEPTLELLVHELGHTFGLGHALASRCVYAYGCTVFDPGDPFTPMGTGDQLLDFSAYEKVLLGWLPPQPRITRAGRQALAAPSPSANAAQALVVDTEQGQYWLEYRSQPFTGVLVRFVDAHQAPSVFAPRSTLIIDPTGPSRDWIAPGETYRAKDYRADDIFKLRLATAGRKQGQIQFAWTDRAAPSAPYLVDAESATPSETRIDWTASIDPGSGVAYYAVQVDMQKVLRVDATEADFPALTPGRHMVSVVAVDRAGNRSRPTRISFVVS